ncbi:GIY-YIG nuclease family protein [Salisediminibacterium selenitireducens]|uniref:Helicase A859L n=1 Tax=Bacillus selenitireducens (strain ATCC 700615 / DSM 15326 / MLS10) TaxID=439292 RepID=D6XYY3_BACIE|nr:GIY-YIG nuclease family protein [Salisediminibacterium selenitireducens]ADH98291.1 Putative helicase A859L [[Bacillus] selenitireducens MLS10]
MESRYFSIVEIMESSLFHDITSPPKKPQNKYFDPEVEKFLDIIEFVKIEGREPKKNPVNITERNLASRLIGIRKDPNRIEYLKEYDELGLLVDKQKEFSIPQISSIDDILINGSPELLGGGKSSSENASIFDTESLKKTTKMPEDVAKRKRIENFKGYDELFKKCHRELTEGKRKIVAFKNEQDIQENSFFILKGILLFVESVGERKKEKGKNNARLRCIFENGTESNMLLRSLSAELYKHGRRVTENEEIMLDNFKKNDVSTGYIYVLKSLSKDPQISSIKNLYKIGYTTGTVEKRIRNAENESTFLYAPVEIVTTYQVYNMNGSKFETAIHRALANKNLDVSILGPNKKDLSPREWFLITLEELQDLIDSIVMSINLYK